MAAANRVSCIFVCSLLFFFLLFCEIFRMLVIFVSLRCALRDPCFSPSFQDLTAAVHASEFNSSMTTLAASFDVSPDTRDLWLLLPSVRTSSGMRVCVCVQGGGGAGGGKVMARVYCPFASARQSLSLDSDLR